jgi:hypothetical protein
VEVKAIEESVWLDRTCIGLWIKVPAIQCTRYAGAWSFMSLVISLYVLTLSKALVRSRDSRAIFLWCRLFVAML